MNRNVKLSYNNTKYVINLKNTYLKGNFHIFKTNEQLRKFFIILIDKNLISTIINKKVSIVKFIYKNKQFIAILNVYPNPQRKATIFIDFYRIVSKIDLIENIIKKCPDENLIDLGIISLPARIVVRKNHDYFVDRISLYKNSIFAYISNYIYQNYKYFLEKYNIAIILIKIAYAILDENSQIEKNDLLDQEPFWLWLIDNDTNDKYLICCSLSTVKENGITNYQLLIDSITKEYIEQKLEFINGSKEKLFNIEIDIKRKIIKKRNKEIKIVKKLSKRREDGTTARCIC